MMSTNFPTVTKHQEGFPEGEASTPCALQNYMDSSFQTTAWDDLLFGADDMNKLGDFEPESFTAPTNVYPPHMPKNQDIFDILTEVENVLDSVPPSSMFTGLGNDDLADDLFQEQPSNPNISDDMLLLEPTPMGPASQVKIVDQVPVTANPWRNDESILSVLDPFLALKRKMINDSFSCQPFKKQRISSSPDMKSSSSPIFDFPSQLSSSLEDEPSSPDNSDANSTNNNRFRSYQEEQWWERFTELMEYNKVNGHCLVPHKYPENPLLAQWVKRQRYQYKLKARGDHSTLSDDRQDRLEALGFVWDSHRAAWDERFLELRAFQMSQGHVNVPSGYKHNPTLAVWVKCQRRQYRLYRSGKASNMNEERVSKLNSINFVWNPRQG